MYTFDELLNLLPDCDAFPIIDTKHPSVGHQTNQPANFIPPNLSTNNELTHQKPEDTPVVIISAPGAVGKSTLGKAIAFNKKVLFWDLAVAGEVGSSSLDGMLLGTIGNQRIGEFSEYLEEGFQFLVIDALDEGRIKVTENSFWQLLQNISVLSQNALSPRFVLLGRTRIAEEAWLVLSEAGIEASLLSIEPFTQDQANRFISNKVGAAKDTPIYRECRDLIFERLEQSIHSGTASVDDFLHYPPVLDVVSTFLREESNPISLKNELIENQGTIADKPLELLQDVIERILKREQDEKVIPAIKQRLGEKAAQEKWENWNTLYEVDEQRKRLLASVLRTQVAAPPNTLPDSLKSEYEEAISAFLAEHPFLQGLGSFANVVFQSYLYASALKGYCGDELKAHTTEDLLKRERLPTRLLADFYLSPIPTEQDASPKISPAHLGILYDSLISSESIQSYVRLNIDGPEAEDSDFPNTEIIEGEFEFLQEDSVHDTQISSIPFSIEIAPDSVISFKRGLRDAFITVPCIVELGNNTPEFQIGPAVQINSKTIRINSQLLIVGANTRLRPQEEDANPVILEALACEASPSIRRPTVYDTSRLLVAWPGDERHPWTDFRAERIQENFGDDQSLASLYRRIRRIATQFVSHSKGSLARRKEILEHRFLLQGDVGKALLEQLLTDQIITAGVGTSYNLYFWNGGKANSLLGVTWQDLRQGAMPETLREYLSKFIREHPELF